MSEAEEWREHIAELRRVAEQTSDGARRQRFLDLVRDWEAFVDALGTAKAAEQRLAG